MDVATLRARGVESDLSDDALAGFLSDAEQAIEVRLGPSTGIVLHDPGGMSLVQLDPPAGAVTEVTENGGDPLVEDTDYRLRPSGQFLERLSGGHLTTWGRRVQVTYDAVPDTARRERVLVDLVKLALEFSGLASARDGDYAEQGIGDYQAERERLIDELRPPSLGFA